MSKTKERSSYKERHGTTRIGDALRWFAKAGKNVAPMVLDLAGKVTGIEGLDTLADAIKGDKGLTEEDRSMLLAALEQDRIEMQEVTKRWQADMASDSYLSKNIRPLTLAALLVSLFVFVILDASFSGFTIKEAWVSLLSSLLLVVFGGYFGARSVEKVMKIKKKE